MASAYDQFLNSLTTSMRDNPNLPKATPEFFQEFVVRFRKRISVERLMDEAVRVYANHFSHEEITQILAFETSPAGRKFRSKTLALQKDLVLGFQQLGASVGWDIGVEIEREHPEWVKAPPEPAKK